MKVLYAFISANACKIIFQSSLAVGALFGGIIAGPMVDVLGRKVAIIVGAIPFEIGWLLLICAKNHLMLYSGRIITGLGCGIETLAVAVSSDRL